MSLSSGDPHSSEQQAVGVDSSNMMIAAMLKTNETKLKALREEISAYEEKCDKLEEANKQNTELVVYTAKEKKELESELEAVRKEKLEYEEKCTKLEIELKDMGKQSFHFEEKSEELKKEVEMLKQKGNRS